jgi:hypothetical protein
VEELVDAGHIDLDSVGRISQGAFGFYGINRLLWDQLASMGSTGFYGINRLLWDQLASMGSTGFYGINWIA